MLEQVFLRDMGDLSVLDRWQVPNDGPWAQKRPFFLSASMA
jgi:hypothetical protein